VEIPVPKRKSTKKAKKVKKSKKVAKVDDAIKEAKEYIKKE